VVSDAIKEPEGKHDVCVIELSSPLRSKSNYRRSQRGSSSSGEWEDHRAFEKELSMMALAARPTNWPEGDKKDKVSNRPGYVVLIVARTTLDSANMAKSATDALQGVLFHNDASVRLVSCLSIRTKTNQSATILIEALRPGSSTNDALQSAAYLSNKYEELHPE
jgi:hypothetical protein